MTADEYNLEQERKLQWDFGTAKVEKQKEQTECTTPKTPKREAVDLAPPPASLSHSEDVLRMREEMERLNEENSRLTQENSQLREESAKWRMRAKRYKQKYKEISKAQSPIQFPASTGTGLETSTPQKATGGAERAGGHETEWEDDPEEAKALHRSMKLSRIRPQTVFVGAPDP